MLAGSYRSVGKTYDGVTVLAPKTKPTHFTTEQIRSTIKDVLSKPTTVFGSTQEEVIARTRELYPDATITAARTRNAYTGAPDKQRKN